jgi:hypothetical protein
MTVRPGLYEGIILDVGDMPAALHVLLIKLSGE